jgi:uncharacterized circularly permuted ATP-grasp superfamily protein
MIDWTTAMRCAAVLVEDPAHTQSVVEAVQRDAPCLQNRAFPLSPLPLMIQQQAVLPVVEQLTAYVRLLDKVVDLYRTDESLRQWYALGPAAEALIDAEPNVDAGVAVCRLDGYFEQATERLVLLENNADAPAGTLFSARINLVVRDVLERMGIPVAPMHPLTYQDEAALLALLLRCLSRAGASVDMPHVAVLQPSGRANRESHEMAEVFRRRDVNAYVADPRDLRVVGGRAYFGSRPVDVCWNKVNTVAWRSLVEQDKELVKQWMTALSGTSLVHINSFGARYVAESKLTLALLAELRFADLFTAQERTLAAALLPWARRLSKTALAEDEKTLLCTEMLERQADYVIKQPYDIRGDGVTIGRAVSRGVWEHAVADALKNGYLAQRYVLPTAYPVQRSSGPPVVAMPVSFDTYVFAGEVQGFGSKASLNARVNVFQGGQKLAVYVI